MSGSIFPAGPANSIEPGGPDQGQPTHFLPRRNQFVFRIRVPRDFGNRELIWTLTSNGKTEKAYGSLKPDYVVNATVMAANFGAGGQTARCRISSATWGRCLRSKASSRVV